MPRSLSASRRPCAAGPGGAIAVSGIAVGLLMLGWLFIYVFVFLPRGTVG